jgi:hypothetical protein
MKGVQPKTRWFVKLHRSLIKPPHPTNINCPACGRWMMRVNSYTIELENSHGVNFSELKAGDRWSQHKHSCSALITLYWKD